MRRRAKVLASALGVALALLLVPASVRAQRANVTCTMGFTLKGWSVFYKTGQGLGRVSCNNGQAAAVQLRVSGGGLSFGKSEVAGTGTFSGVRDLREVFGTYGTSGAHAGAVRSGSAQAMTKGNVSLALAGTGRGWDVGFYFGKLEILPLH